MVPAAGQMWARGSQDVGWQTEGDTAIDLRQQGRETLKVEGFKSMLNFASNETPAFLLASKRASQLQITVSPFDFFLLINSLFVVQQIMKIDPSTHSTSFISATGVSQKQLSCLQFHRFLDAMSLFSLLFLFIEHSDFETCPQKMVHGQDTWFI